MMGLWVLWPMGVSLLFTVVLELCFAFLWGIRDKKDILLLVLVNLLTNPFVVLTHYLVTYYTDINPLVIIILLEVTAALTEGYYFRNHGNTYRKPMLFAIGANLFSYCTGRIINWLAG